jgi:hypothetical protein
MLRRHQRVLMEDMFHEKRNLNPQEKQTAGNRETGQTMPQLL